MNIHINDFGAIVDAMRLKEALSGLSDKRGKIARMLRSGELIQLRRGLYATRRDVDPFSLAASIYGPSYISFETALAHYGMIPEAVYEITSATLKRPKTFENDFGRFRYQAIPEAVYAIGVELQTESEIPYLIASPTKALCDRIALEPRMRSMADVRRWAEGMRLDLGVAMNAEILDSCAETYGRPSVRLLRDTIKRYGGLQ